MLKSSTREKTTRPDDFRRPLPASPDGGRPDDLLLAHGVVVAMDSSRGIIEDGAVAIAGGRIEAVGPASDLLATCKAERVINCAGRAIIPGLIDAHGRGGHSLLKTLGSDTPSLWMKIVTPAYFHFTTPRFWHVDGLISALERLRAGVTCGASVIGSIPRSDDPAFGINHARAYAQIGLREIVCVGPAGLPWPRPVSRWDSGQRARRAVGFDDMLAGAEAVIEACDGAADGRIKVYLTPFTIVPSVDPSNPTTPDQATKLTADDRLQARRIRETAAKWKVRIHSDAFGGMVRMAIQDREHALLGPDVHFAALHRPVARRGRYSGGDRHAYDAFARRRRADLCSFVRRGRPGFQKCRRRGQPA